MTGRSATRLGAHGRVGYRAQSPGCLPRITIADSAQLAKHRAAPKPAARNGAIRSLQWMELHARRLVSRRWVRGERSNGGCTGRGKWLGRCPVRSIVRLAEAQLNGLADEPELGWPKPSVHGPSGQHYHEHCSAVRHCLEVRDRVDPRHSPTNAPAAESYAIKQWVDRQ